MSADEISWRRRMAFLLQAVADVAPPDHPAAGAAGSTRHQTLFEQYRAELAKARRSGEKWYSGLIESEEERTGDHWQAVANTRKRRPVGPVSDPDVTATVRNYWLRCVALNEGLAAKNRVAPEEFVLKWLADRGHEPLAEFLTGYPFWPLGMDANDHWV